MDKGARTTYWYQRIGGGRHLPLAAVFALVLGCLVTVAPARAELGGDYERFGAIGGAEGKPLNFDKLRELLREAKGIGLVAKLKLRSKISDFTTEFSKFHKGIGQRNLQELQARFNELHARIVQLLGPKNPQLSMRFERARGALWHAYRDKDAFAKTVGKGALEAGASTGGKPGDPRPGEAMQGLDYF